MANTNPFPVSDKASDMYLPDNGEYIYTINSPETVNTTTDFVAQHQQLLNNIVIEQSKANAMMQAQSRSINIMQSLPPFQVLSNSSLATGSTTSIGTITTSGVPLSSHAFYIMDTQEYLNTTPVINETEELLTKLDKLEKKYADKNRHSKSRKVLNWFGL